MSSKERVRAASPAAAEARLSSSYTIDSIDRSIKSASLPRTMQPPSVHVNSVKISELASAEKKSLDSSSAASSSNNPTTPHIEVQFNDPTTKFFCRIYFAREFHQLRQVVFGDGEDRFIRSLSRSAKWHASGGKSGSEFSKTIDERFVIKQVSKIEIASFLEFGPNYISYILQRIRNNNEDAAADSAALPLSLAKIVGVYKIGFRNAAANTALKQDVLVMENLFYRRTISQVYDLKGSLRNRLADVASSSSEASATLPALEQVLLDENYLRLSIDAPLYVRPEVKRCLNAVIQCDSQFLMSHAVMDYSLLVGVDTTRHELVVGIIDYIRTFTWHKRLEMMVKSSGLLGGQGRMPTIVSPHLYQARFCEAMQRYFLPVPDKWYRFADDDECVFVVDDNAEEAAKRRVEYTAAAANVASAGHG